MNGKLTKSIDTLALAVGFFLFLGSWSAVIYDM